MATTIEYALSEEQLLNGVTTGYLIWEIRSHYKQMFPGWNGHIEVSGGVDDLIFIVPQNLTEQQKNHVINFISSITQQEEDKLYDEPRVKVTVHIAPDAIVDGIRTALIEAGSNLTFKFLPKSTGTYAEGNYDASQRYYFNRVPNGSEETVIRNALRSLISVEVYGQP